MKRLIFILLIQNFVFSTEIFSQKQMTACSGNSRFFAVSKYVGKTKDTIEQYTYKGVKQKKVTVYSNKIDIYKVATLEKLRSFEFYTTSKEFVDRIGLSDNGLICFARAGSNYSVWNIVTGKNIYKSDYVRNIGFSNSSGIIAVADFDRMYTYDVYSGEEKNKFNLSRNLTIDTIFFSEDDKMIICKTSNQRIYTYNTENGKLIKVFSGDKILFPNDTFEINVYKEKNNKVYSYYYDTTNFSKTNSFVSSKFINSLNKDIRNELKEKDKLDEYTPIELKLNNSRVTTDGKIMILSAKQDKIDILFCFSNLTFELLSFVSSDMFSADYPNVQLSNYQIYDDKLLILPLSDDLAGVYDINTNEIGNLISFQFEEQIGGYHFPTRKQLEISHISPNYKYILIELKNNKNPQIFAKSTIVHQKPSHLEGAVFLDYSPNSKYIFVTKNDTLGYFKTFDIASDIGDNISLTFNQFGDSLVYPTPEDFISEDADYPDGYEFNIIKKFKYIGDVDDSILVKLHLKTISSNQDSTGIQVHLLDDEGTYYYGASAEQWKYVWKSLFLQSEKSNKISKINEFVIEEYHGSDSLPNAIAIVMDHSGSMGTQRANEIQKAAQKFIENKNSDDGVIIIKYDGKIGMETKFSTKKEKLLKSLNINGLKGYGGCTSLLDAINYAVTVLEEKDEFHRKSVVLLTDGNENSSVLTKGHVLKNSVKNDINIYTIGFGNFVSEEYLQALAYFTQGSYYHIYKTEQFSYIFDDIYKKMQNYYTIKFKTDTIGEFTALLEIAIDENRKDSLVTSFSNEPVDFDAMDEEIVESNGTILESEFKPPLKEINITHFAELKEFEAFSDSIQIVEQKIQDSLIVVEKAKQDSITKEFEKIDFPNVKFVFNETTIISGTETGIEQVIEFMKKNETIIIEIQGYTDSQGSKEFNLELSQKRADKIKELITNSGIPSERLVAKGYGEEKLLSQKNTETAKAQNRRVEFVILSF